MQGVGQDFARLANGVIFRSEPHDPPSAARHRPSQSQWD